MVISERTRRLVVAGWLMLAASGGLLAAEPQQSVKVGDQQVLVAPLRLPGVRRVVIEQNGDIAPAAEDTQPPCAKFRLGVRDVREYLRSAQLVNQHDYLHALDWSPCYASGTVFFSDGSQGVWGIQQLRAGSLKLNDGRELFLFCPQCKSRVFPRP